jgi:hypothetical protein
MIGAPVHLGLGAAVQDIRRPTCWAGDWAVAEDLFTLYDLVALLDLCCCYRSLQISFF